MADETAHISEEMKVCDPFRGYQEGDEVTISLYDTYLEITGDKNPVKVNYDQLTGAVHGTAQELHKTENRTIAGSFVGDVVGGLFGDSSLGDLVGGTAGFLSSGLHKDEYHKRLFITYLNDEGDEVAIHLMDEKNKQGKEIAKELSEYAKIKVQKTENL